MKKNYYWSLLTYIMVAVLSVGFTTCGGDDDEDSSSSGSGSTDSISLVGKSFYKSETNYNEAGEKEVNRVNITFETSSKCTLRCWGSWENIYSDGSKDTYKYDTGDMTGKYTISDGYVHIRISGNEGYDRDIPIVNGELLGYQLSN